MLQEIAANDVIRSSDEFQKPLATETRKRSSQGGPKSENGEVEKSIESETQNLVRESGEMSVLKGGIKKRRLHSTNRSSLFTPLS